MCVNKCVCNTIPGMHTVVCKFRIWGILGGGARRNLVLESSCPCRALQLNVFEIFAVKRPKFRPKVSDLWDPLGASSPKEEKTCPGPIQSCKISRRSRATVAEISVTGQRNKETSELNLHVQYPAIS